MNESGGDAIPRERDLLRQGRQATQQRLFAAIVSLTIFISTGLLTAATTFIILSNYPVFVRSPIMPAIWGTLTIAMPVLWGIAIVLHDSISRALLKVHAAIFTVSLIVDIGEMHVYAGPALLILFLARSLFVIFIGIDLWVAHVSLRRAVAKSRRIAGPQFLYLGLTISAIAGLHLGVRAWSPTMPPLVIASAETAADDQPYCIIVDGVPARNADDLTGRRMQARYDGNYAFNFHALLVVKANSDFIYFNWSYHNGKFEPVSEHARWDLHLDTLQCKPDAHFARDWRG